MLLSLSFSLSRPSSSCVNVSLSVDIYVNEAMAATAIRESLKLKNTKKSGPGKRGRSSWRFSVVCVS